MTDLGQDTMLLALKRAHGQLAGVIRMYEEERPCLEIIQQLVAVRSALSSAAKGFLAGEAQRCARSQKPEDFDKILKSLIDVS